MTTESTGEGPIFIVGSPRSGNSLLRAMLDAHPRLAIARENSLISRFDPGVGAFDAHVTLERMIADPESEALRQSPEELRRRISRAEPATYAAFVREIFAGFAAARGKSRWGVKQPENVLEIPRLARLFPDGQFLHIIRDGREVAASMIEFNWGPKRPTAAAFWWRRSVEVGRRNGRKLEPDRYMELRLEDLVAAPDEILARVCAFLHEQYRPEMLDYHVLQRRRAAHRKRPLEHAHLDKPPTKGLRDWKAQLSSRQIAAVETACGKLLGELGYPPARKSLLAMPAVGIESAIRTLSRARSRIIKREYLTPGR